MNPSTRIGTPRRALACRFGASLLLVTALLGTSYSTVALAEGSAADSERANLLFKKGKIAFNAGKYADALRIYSEAWGLKKSPDIAANLAQTESELGKHRDAAEHFAFALAHLLPSSTDEQKAALAEGLEAEKKEIGSLHVTLEPADSQLSIDNQPVVVPPSGDVYLEPGDHRASVTHEGYEPSQQPVRLSKGAAQVLWIRLQPSNAAGAAHSSADTQVLAPPNNDSAPLESTHHSARSLVPAIVGGGLFVAGAAVGVAFMLSANSSQNDADALRTSIGGGAQACNGSPRPAECDALHQKNSDVDHARTIEVTGFVVAGAAAAGTAAYLLWPQSTANTTATRLWHPTLAVAPGFTSLGLTGRF